LNTSAPIVASRPDRRHRGALAAAFAAALGLALAGCASKPKRPEPPPPEVSVPPLPPPPARPRPPVPPPVAAPGLPPMPPARNFGEEKARRRLELATDPRNTIGGAEVGYYLDVLLGRLKQSLGPETGIARQGQHIVVVLPASAAFPVGGARLPPGLRAKLAPLSQALLEYRRVLVSVYVRADASVIGASNPRLREQRAQVIAAYLGGAGLDPRRVLLAPPGPGKPSATRPGIGGRTRIEIELEPILRPGPRARARA
jgi:outer membrane protein OmpA-like peptidoglycan-associated protein